jgi:hypothetical protein
MPTNVDVLEEDIGSKQERAFNQRSCKQNLNVEYAGAID